MEFASKAKPHLLQYDPAKLPTAFKTCERNADDFMFGLNRTREARHSYACNFMGVRTTYAELDEEVEALGRALLGYGIAEKDYVSVSLPNIKEAILYTYALWRIGAVVNLIDPRTNGSGILERVKNTNSKLLVTVLDICEPKIDEIIDELPLTIVVSPVDSILRPSRHIKPTLGRLLYKVKKKKFQQAREELFAAGKYTWHTHMLANYCTDNPELRSQHDPDTPAAIIYTSGTTADGVIKGAVHTHLGFNAAPAAFAQSVRPEEYGRGLTFGGFIPFFSSYGAFAGMHSNLCAGMEILLVPIFDPNKFAQLVLRLKPNIFLGVPHFFEQLTRHPKLQKKNNRLRFATIPVSGGDKISLTTLQKVNDTLARSGCKAGLRVGYGSTELGGSISVMRYYPADDSTPKTEGDVGTLLPNIWAMVVDPDTMQELPYGEDGELLLGGMSMMREYHGMPEQTAEITYIAPDGTKYYRTGDRGHLDDKGTFFFAGRYKRSMMRPDGHTVHPSPIENVIAMHPQVEKCAVVGLRQSEDAAGTIPSAFVVLKDADDLPDARREAVLREIDALCLKHLPERDRAIAYKVVEDLPYTPMGKVFFRELEEELFDEQAFYVADRVFCSTK